MFVLNPIRRMGVPHPHSLLTANICGGLGNQLFQVANLLACAARHNMPMAMERLPVSDSIDAPRPTYWDSAFSRFCEVCPALAASSSTDPLQPQASSEAIAELPRPPAVVTLGESRPLGGKKVFIPDLLPARVTGSRTDMSHDVKASHHPTLYTLVGFFQSQNYFDDYEQLVRDVLVDPSLEAMGRRAVLEGYCGVEAQDEAAVDAAYHNRRPHTIAMHVRRGDYLTYSDTFETLSFDYYEGALRQLLGGMLLRGRRGGALGTRPAPKGGQAAPLKVLIFTDDASYGHTVAERLMQMYPLSLDAAVVCEANEKDVHTSGLFPTTFTPAPLFVEGEDEDAARNGSAIAARPLPRDVRELYMMAACDDVIIANSTFSWWGAFMRMGRADSIDGTLERSLGRVVAPLKWFVKEPYPMSRHLYCKGWMVL